MAIAVDASATGSVGNNTSLTFAHTCTGSNLLLVVGIQYQPSAADVVTSVTYNAVGMTRINGATVGGFGSSVWLYYLLAPSTGANNVVITLNTSQGIRGFSRSYTGVKQSGQPDASSTTSQASQINAVNTLTTVADNSVHVVMQANSDGGAVTPTNATPAAVDAVVYGIWESSPLAITPAGSHAITLALGSGTPSWTLAGASFSPAADAQGVSTNFLSLTGVGT